MFSTFTKCTTFPLLSFAKGCTSTRGSKAKRKPSGGPPTPMAVSKRPSSNPSSCPTSYGKASVSFGITWYPTRGKKPPASSPSIPSRANSGSRRTSDKIQQITTPAALYELMKDKTLVIHDLRVINNECLEISYDKDHDNAAGGQTTNGFIAAITTCWARLRLYHHLNQVEENALYFDIDSVVYKWQPGQPEIPLGNFLGEMTDELDMGTPIVTSSSNSHPAVPKTMPTEHAWAKWK